MLLEFNIFSKKFFYGLLTQYKTLSGEAANNHSDSTERNSCSKAFPQLGFFIYLKQISGIFTNLLVAVETHNLKRVNIVDICLI